MKYSCGTLSLLAVLCATEAFVGPLVPKIRAVGSTTRPSVQLGVTSSVQESEEARAARIASWFDDIEDDLGTPDTPFARRFGHLKGRDVKTVGESMTTFYNTYNRPILPQYRSIITDLLQLSHLNVVDARFVYDKMFAYGLRELFLRLLKSYPFPDEVPKIFEALVSSIDLDLKKINSDADEILNWSKGKTEADLDQALKGEGSSPLVAIVEGIKADEFYLYTKTWAIGLIMLMEATGTETSEAKLEGYMVPIHFPPIKSKQDLEQFKDVLEKLSMAEQLYKEIEIREKKKMADRLEAKAKKALEAAQKAEEEGEVEGEGDDEEEEEEEEEEGEVMPQMTNLK